jgi:predicted phosphodiesterase
MRIAVASDIHLEFGPIELENTENAEVLILSGDICVAAELHGVKEVEKTVVDRFDRSKHIHNFFQTCCKNFSHVIYIMGNHEHYHGDFANTITELKEKLGYLVNLHILDKEMVTLGGIKFIGGTLWTNMNDEDPVTLSHVRGFMNDFKQIADSRAPVHYKDLEGKYRTRTGKFSPIASVIDHKEMLHFIRGQVDENPNSTYVICGHHSPSKASTHPRYQTEKIVNGAYSSELSEFILDRPQIKLWTHGHTHEVFDYMIGDCRVVCNPRGYIRYEQRADEFSLQFVEV